MNAAKWRLLIADPDPDVSRSLQNYFSDFGHEVQLVAEANQVVTAARQWQPSVIFVSTEFADQDPYAVCQELLADMMTSHIPVLMLLHHNERKSRLKALEVGVDDIVAKPIDLEELQLRTEAAVRLSTLQIRS